LNQNKAEKPAHNRLVELAPIVRGLLAEPSGSEDVPFRPVILDCLTDSDAVDFASAPDKMKSGAWPAGIKKTDSPPLYVDLPASGVDDEKVKDMLRTAISDYETDNGRKPATLCLKNLGILSVSRPAQEIAGSPLENKVALVTGAAGAIGYGVCRGLLGAGCFLAATDLPGRKLDAFTEDLKRPAPDRVIAVGLDVADKDSVADGFRSVIRTWGGIDVVVINAGIALVSKLKEMDLEAFRRLERVNVEGTLLTIAEASRHLILQGTGGDIIIMSTKNVPSPGAGFGAYSATKAACHQLGRIASLELAEYDIRVNMVAPDAVFSEGKYRSGLWEEVGPDRMKARGLDEKGLHEYYRKRNLLKARVTGRHVANAVLFFATRQTPTTGATIPVDGGLPDATHR